MSVGDVILGVPLPDRVERRESVGPTMAIPVLGLDALASVAYGPEAALTVLWPLGPLASGQLLTVMVPIAVLLAVVGISYWQAIAAYPGEGGAYTAAKQNLGTRAGLLAGASLALDYILNVAVAIAAGVGALVSAVPPLLPFTLPLGLGILTILTLVNLRGVRDVGNAWAIPTYAFILSILAVIGIGLYRVVATSGHPDPVVAPPAPTVATGAVSLWLLLRAFGSGSTAMTGVEAVSNAVPIFREPRVNKARRTLIIIVLLQLTLIVGLTVLCRSYGIAATPPGQAGYQSVLSQVVGAVVGRGLPYQLAMATVLTVLALSANTSFAAFPRLCRVMAMDGFLPEEFAQRGRRLVYSRGIVLLSVIAGALLVAFDGVTDPLIPLFAIGALGAFTMSQAAMAKHWSRVRGRGWRGSTVLNGVGALATAATLLVIVVTRFSESAWVSVLILGGFMLLFRAVARHQRNLDQQLGTAERIDFRDTRPPIVVVPLRRLNHAARRALRFAVQLSHEVQALQVRSETGDDLRQLWPELVEGPAREADVPAPKLVTLVSEYREFVGPVVDYVQRLTSEGREVVVVVPEVVPRHWYHYLLHGNHATLLKAAFLLRGGPRVTVANTPWYE